MSAKDQKINLDVKILEMLEDLYLSRLAEKRDQPGVETYSHDEAWKSDVYEDC